MFDFVFCGDSIVSVTKVENSFYYTLFFYTADTPDYNVRMNMEKGMPTVPSTFSGESHFKLA